MDRSERFYKIGKLLNRGKPVCTATLLQTLEPYSRYTLGRDIDYLKLHFNAPIVYDRKQRAYQLEPTDARIELPGIWFTPAEAHALMVLGHLLNGIQAGFLEAHLKPIQARIQKVLEKGDTTLNELQRRIRVLQMASRNIEPRYFELVSHAVITRRRLHIQYKSRERDDITQRDISPQRLVHYRDNWYLDAYCHLRSGLRTFSLDCIRDLKLLDKKAHDIPETKLDTILGSSYGIFAGKAVYQAVLRFTAHRAQWVANERWHPQQQGQFAADGTYLLKIPYADHRELLMDILKFGADVEVLEPKILRAQVRDSLAKASHYYAR